MNMAAKDLSKTFSEMESDDISLETSVPTDMTFSPSSDDLIGQRHKQGNKSIITKQFLERNQLLHDMELLKIEQSQKSMLYDNQKCLFQQANEELEEKLNDAMHQKQLMQVRLESELRIQREETLRRTAAIRKELEELTSKQKQLEETNIHLAAQAGSVRNELNDISITEEEFYQLRSHAENDLSLRDFIRMKHYNVILPMNTELKDLTLRNTCLEEKHDSLADKILILKQELEEEKNKYSELLVKYEKVMSNLVDTRLLVKEDDFKVVNFDAVKGDRDQLEQGSQEAARQLAVLQASYTVLQVERDELHKELSSTKQLLVLVKQDKEYLSRQVADEQRRCKHGTEKIEQINQHLEEAKNSREMMYEKYISSRDQSKTEYDMRLNEQLQQLKIKTTSEIDRLRIATQEMYERENRNLREARDLSISEKERAVLAEKELSAKYDQLLTAYRQQQSDIDCQVSSTNSQLKLKAFECERTHMVYEEQVTNSQKALLEVDKMQAKFEVLTKEYYAMQTSYDKKVAELESQLVEKNVRLESYEKLEHELDDVVLQAAEVEDNEQAENVLFSYGYGANVPSNAKRRMKQSVQLAQRVLHLERSNTSLQSEVDNEKVRTDTLMKELANANDLLGQSQQPYSYLINTIHAKDTEIHKCKESCSSLQTLVTRLEGDNNQLSNVKNQMSLDIEKLLNQRQEIGMIKKVILGLTSCQPDNPPVSPRASHPKPTLFTKQMPPWYQKLQQQKSASSTHF